MIPQAWQAFSTAEHLALEADDSWEVSKEEGNIALKQGGFLRAAELYHESALIALGPLEGGILDAFISALEGWPAGSAHRALSENWDVLWENIVRRLPVPPSTFPRRILQSDGAEIVGAYPNKGAAIAWANRAQALLLAGQPEEALISARRATAANPAYVKGHHRELKALQALGNLAEAAEIKEQIIEYEMSRSTYPAEALALLAAGWIDWDCADLVYWPVRFTEAAGKLNQMVPGEPVKLVEVRPSLVPFLGGQGLMLSVALLSGKFMFFGAAVPTVDCMDFSMADNENSEIAYLPPNGHASPESLLRVPFLIRKCIEDLRKFDIITESVMPRAHRACRTNW